MLFEIITIEPLPPDTHLGGCSIDGPLAGDRPEADGFEVDGWVLLRQGPAVAVEIVEGATVRCRVPVERDRPDVGAAYPDFPWAAAAGFRGWVPTAGLSASFTLEVRAISTEGLAIPLAMLHGRQVPDEEIERQEDASDWRGPDFIVIGAQRSGSTSLFEYLSAHPLVAPAKVKEVKYFSFFHQRPRSWYRSQFPSNVSPGVAIGEATPYYLFHPLAARRIKERAPQTRLITLLRNPIDRAYSHYAHERRRGTETLSFEEALQREAERLAGEAERMRADETYQSLAHQHFSYQARGMYAEQLQRWRTIVPPDQLLVLRSEDLYAEPAATRDRVTDFLGLPRSPLAAAPPHNEGAYPPMAQSTRLALQRVFDHGNDELRQLLGKDFQWTA